MNHRKMYECGECRDLHEHDWDAEECCKPDVAEVFVCGECGEQHDLEKDAIFCCVDEAEANGEPIPPEVYQARKRELEAAGQQRLIP